MPSVHELKPSFNAGELSPLISARSDIAKYASGCTTLENFVILPYGGVLRRPGLEYLGAGKFGSTMLRLSGFNFSTNTRFILEWGNLYFRFWSNGAPVRISTAPAWETSTDYALGQYVLENILIYFCQFAHTSGTFATDLAAGFWVQQTRLELISPYLEGELRGIKYVQINDVMYLTHPLHPVQKLSRIADDNWTLEEVEWDWPMVLDENITEITLTPGATTGTGISLLASAPQWVTATAYKKDAFVSDSGTIYQAQDDYTSGATVADDLGTGDLLAYNFFQPGNVGGYYQISYWRDAAFVELSLGSSAPSSGIVTIGDWQVTSFGTWTGTLRLQRSYDNGVTWASIRDWTGKDDRNVSDSGSEGTQSMLRLDYTSTSGSGRAILELVNAKQDGVVKITSVTDGWNAVADVTVDLQDTGATIFWSEGAWSTLRGFPNCVTLFQQRIMYGGNAYRPLNVWGSVINDFENLRLTTLDDGGLSFTIASTQGNSIQWMKPQRGLVIGTSGEEWTMDSGSTGGALSPSNVQVTFQSSYGSSSLVATAVNNVILFVQRQRRKLREFTYVFAQDNYEAPDITVLSEHVTEGGILESAYQQQPDAIYWTITGAGQLVGMTYERDQQVVGWHRHVTDGVFESVATIYGDDQGNADEVWVAVKRTINGRDVRTVERLKTDSRAILEAEDKANWFYVDSGQQIVNTNPTTTVTGLDHLEGETVAILGDGAVQPNRVVQNGTITLQQAASNIIVGLPYVSTLQSMRLEQMLQDGTTRGRLKRVARLVVSIYKSLGGMAGASIDAQFPLYMRSTSDPMDSSPPVFTGDKELSLDSGWIKGQTVFITQSEPLPLSILAIVPIWEASPDQ